MTNILLNNNIELKTLDLTKEDKSAQPLLLPPKAKPTHTLPSNKRQKSLFEKFKLMDRYNKYNQKFDAKEDFQGPTLTRKYTDIFCIPCILLLQALLIFGFVYSFSLKNLDSLQYLDFRASKCGQAQLSDKPFLYYIQPAIDMSVRICVSSCPN